MYGGSWCCHVHGVVAFNQQYGKSVSFYVLTKNMLILLILKLMFFILDFMLNLPLFQSSFKQSRQFKMTAL